ncbi:putative prophage tail fiber protein [Klebsiella pneumoniae]|nr:putative prophage tail fiber protein [Klebsiella pneumoniae]
MALKFKSVVTTAGQARIAAAMANGTQVDIKQMAVGDGNGQPTTPVASQTALVHEVYRQAVNSTKVDKTRSNWMVVETIIPASSGGFWMRELGLIAGDGTLLAVCNMAETYKPTLEEGSGRTQTLRMVIAVSDSEAIALTLDDSLIFATEEYVNLQIGEHEKTRNHPDASLTAKGLIQLSSATNSSSEILAATPKAVKAAYDLANRNYLNELYPIGIVLWFAQNKNPNTLFPGTKWSYIGENKTIRLGSQNGSDVMTSGGADTITLAAANIPAHSHTFSATTSAFDYGTKTTSSFNYGNKTTSTFDHGTKTTNTTGNHTHTISPALSGGGSIRSANLDWSGPASTNTGAAGNHAHTVAIGAHSHSVAIGEHNHTVGIGAHTHTVSGTTANTGSGAAINVTNAFVKLMGWYRTA